MKGSFLGFTIVALMAALLVSCAGGIGDSPYPSLNYADSLTVIETKPQSGATDVALDTQIEITIDQEIEEFFPSQIKNLSLTLNGVPVAGKSLSAKLIPHPQNPTMAISKLIFKPSRYLFPNQDYVFRWREAPEKGSQDAAELAGIMSRFGNPPARMAQGGITFKTGTRIANNPNPDGVSVLEITPGRMISSSFTGTLTDAFTDLISPAANTPIRIFFSEPITHWSVDVAHPYTPEIPWTNICAANSGSGCFRGLTLFTFSAANLTSNLLNELNTALSNQSTWFNYLATHYQSVLQGKVRTTNGRRVLEFQLNPGATYPNNIAQAVIAVLHDFRSWDSYPGVPPRTLVNNYAVGGFIHFSGYQWPSGFPDLNQFLRPPGGQ